MRENRVLRSAQLRASGGRKLSGYAAVFDSQTSIGGFDEVVRPGAFTRSLREGADIRCLYNHNADFVLGRTRAKTLRLKEDETGLHFDCDTPDTQAARDLLVSVERGDIDGSSFAFAVRKQRWTEGADGSLLRELVDLDLFDVSPVTFPAYSATSVGARTLWPQGVPVEVSLRCRPGPRLSASSGCYLLRPALRCTAYNEESLERARLVDRVRIAVRQ